MIPTDLSPHGDTLAAVVLGAMLATISGVVANQIEARIRRREREKSAALLFGEVLSSMRIMLEGAARVREVGDPYGPVTRRMLHAARRELDIYDRNREALMDLRDAPLRAEMHRVVIRVAMPLDSVLDSLVDGRDGDDDVRDRGFEFMMTSVALMPPLVARLARIAGHGFEHYDALPMPGAPGS